ncbi:MAG: hypothetical protein IKI19_06385, partial [Prevotella sp.]|nr:hypothetical protein [Prevotella sp.]
VIGLFVSKIVVSRVLSICVQNYTIYSERAKKTQCFLVMPFLFADGHNLSHVAVWLLPNGGLILFAYRMQKFGVDFLKNGNAKFLSQALGFLW